MKSKPVLYTLLVVAGFIILGYIGQNIDLIPDRLPLIGSIDDFAVSLAGIFLFSWLYFRLLKKKEG